MAATSGNKPPVYDRVSLKRRLIGLPLLAILLTLIIELLNRRLSVAALARFVFSSPTDFLYNALILLATLSFSELFKRRRATLITLSVVWIGLGIAQYMLTKSRTQPFTFSDLSVALDVFSLITLYLTWPQIILIFGGGIALIFLIIVLFNRLPKRERVNLPYAMGTFIALVLACVCVCALNVRAGKYPVHIDSPVDAYESFGFPAMFTYTLRGQGIAKPLDYSEETVTEIIEEIDEPEQEADPLFDDTEHPNIVFLQMESFFDVDTIIGATFSRDPTPCFTALASRYPTGNLYVPIIGGGTVNTEFEIVTGMNVDFFTTGEYPYTTILQERTCESIGYALRDYGYTSTVLHNNTGTFFSRQVTYANLGFDRFISLEYMKDPTYNEIGWCKDDVIADEILRALESTDTRDLCYAITVEGHGKYQETYTPKSGDVGILSLPESLPLAPFQNYVQLIAETDAALGTLIDSLVAFDEPTIVVIYGDHLPGLELSNEVLTTGSVYTGQYILWNNYGAELEAPDLQAYRLSAELFRQLGFTGGTIMRYNQSVPADETDQEYLNTLELLEYDALYGETLYEKTDIEMGSEPILITDVSDAYGRLLVTGKNFTAFSRILVNDEPIDTLYVDSEHIIAAIDDRPVESVCVAQMTDDNVELSRSFVFTVE